MQKRHRMAFAFVWWSMMFLAASGVMAQPAPAPTSETVGAAAVETQPSPSTGREQAPGVETGQPSATDSDQATSGETEQPSATDSDEAPRSPMMWWDRVGTGQGPANQQAPAVTNQQAPASVVVQPSAAGNPVPVRPMLSDPNVRTDKTPPVTTPPPVTVTDDDPFHRRFTFYNQLDIPIYPVIQAPNDSNCTTVDPTKFPKGSLLRIVINADTKGAGIPAKGNVTVAIPMTSPCPPKGGFYDSSRIFVFVASVEDFEAKLAPGQRTQPIALTESLDCPACYAGLALLDYGHDAPAQLLEYTIISQGPNGAALPNANDTSGTPFIDFDVSYVDDVYLPVAMAPAGGVAQFMGSAIDVGTFTSRMTGFLQQADWSRYAAYSELNWNSDQCSGGSPNPCVPNKTVFADLIPASFGRTDKLPSANILVSGVNGGQVSSFYLPTWDGVYPKQCLPDPPNQADNLFCSAVNNLKPPGNILCCPQDSDNVMLGCCDATKFLVDRQSRKWRIVPGEGNFNGHYDQQNPTRDDMVQRWVNWAGSVQNPCITDPSVVAAAPVVEADKASFCANFNTTVDFVWKQFSQASLTDCGLREESQRNQCIASKIIGYDVKADDNFNNMCKLCPATCPQICLVDIQRNESVQALMRGVPWTPAGDPKTTCAACPGTNCPKSCVFPEAALPADGRLWHRDGFLHFWPPYDSAYNLNPYARFVHNTETGLDAPGAYSFSIDDFYGNFGGPGSTLIIEVGGTSQMPDKEPYNPYKQYFVAWGTGWDHARVCNRLIPDAKRVMNVPMSFWQTGVRDPTCEIALYATAAETGPTAEFVKYQVKEVPYTVTDTYTGLQHSIAGLSGVYAQRLGAAPAGPDPFCVGNSQLPPGVKGACNGNLTSAGADLDLPVNTAYVSVSDAPCNGLGFDDPNYFTCGKPLIHVNLPSFVQ
ncbi:MAG TPA: hypothetical protein VMS64_24405 [Candidatus Methylomirabilis sp.]|nr:hypothetical protein [Candidatus Methylomirabilis sp.]